MPTRVAIAALLASATLGAGRCYQVPIQQSRGGDAGAPDEGSIADGGVAQACAAGGPRTILQARVTVGKEGTPGSFVDFEVRGPAHDAWRACRALVRRELAVVYPAETGLTARVVRDCSEDAMAEPDAKGGALLSDRRTLDAELALLPDPCAAAAPDGGARPNVEASERRLSGFDDKASCEAMLEKLRAAGDAAKSDVDAKSTAWLDREIAQLEQQAAASCKPDKSAEPCKRAEALLQTLRDRKATPAPDASRTLVCRVR